jgi:hypothetical protein
MTVLQSSIPEDLESLFNQTFDAIPDDKMIEVRAQWYRQNFRLSGAASPFHYGLKLNEGQVFKGVDSYKRRVIFVGGPKGTIVLYKESVQPTRKPYFAYDDLNNFNHRRPSKLNVETFNNILKSVLIH